MNWTRFLRKEALFELPIVEFLAAEEGFANAARARGGSNKSTWLNVSLRFDQVAVIAVLQKLHLKNTGKEISRADVLSALMVDGLRAAMERPEFTNTITTNTSPQGDNTNTNKEQTA